MPQLNNKKEILLDPDEPGIREEDKKSRTKQWNLLDTLCKAQCTEEEICAEFGCGTELLSNRVKKRYDTTFQEYFQSKRKAGFASLRARQYAKAMQGSDSMLKYLGKNWLKQGAKDAGFGDEDGNPIVYEFVDEPVTEQQREREEE